MAQTESQKPKGQKKKQMLIRYGKMGMLGWFDHKESSIPCSNARVVIKTERGLEIGTVVGAFSYRQGNFKYSREQVEQYHCNRTRDYPLTEGGTFVRFATHEDIMEEKHLAGSADEEAKTCAKFVAEMGLSMKVVDAEHLFGGERVVIYFSSSGRVDFRDLVRQLSREYQTRIELRQIGSRDEARLIGDFESCGQECCCRRFLKILEPVNMRMAKVQKATLNPAKISGYCGRLKCCFRYEDETYKQLKSNLPKKGLLVRCPAGNGRVVDTHILTQLVVVQLESGKREAVGIETIEIIDPPKPSATTGSPPVSSEATGNSPRSSGTKGSSPRSSGAKGSSPRPSGAEGKDKSANAAVPPEAAPLEKPTGTTAHVDDIDNMDTFADNGTFVAWDELGDQSEQVRQDDNSRQDDPAGSVRPASHSDPVRPIGTEEKKDNKRPRGKRRGRRRRSGGGKNNQDTGETKGEKPSGKNGTPKPNGGSGTDKAGESGQSGPKGGDVRQ